MTGVSDTPLIPSQCVSMYASTSSAIPGLLSAHTMQTRGSARAGLTAMRQALPRALHARCARRAQKALPAQAAHQRPVIRAGLASGASHSCFVPALVCALSPPARTPMEHSTVLADASGECGRYAAGSRRTSTGAEPLGSRGQRQRRQEQPRPPHAIEQVDEAPDLDAGATRRSSRGSTPRSCACWCPPRWRSSWTLPWRSSTPVRLLPAHNMWEYAYLGGPRSVAAR